jgi:hypothetical protein
VLRFDQHLMKTQRGSARATVVMAFLGRRPRDGTKRSDNRRRPAGASEPPEDTSRDEIS